MTPCSTYNEFACCCCTQDMLSDANPMVVANALAALQEIAEVRTMHANNVNSGALIITGMSFDYHWLIQHAKPSMRSG